MPGPKPYQRSRSAALISNISQSSIPNGHTKTVFISLPIVLGEQFAELRITESNGFVCTKLLHSYHIRVVEFHAREVFLKSRQGVLQIDFGPILGCCTSDAGYIVVCVGAVLPGIQRTVKARVFDGN